MASEIESLTTLTQLYQKLTNHLGVSVILLNKLTSVDKREASADFCADVMVATDIADGEWDISENAPLYWCTTSTDNRQEVTEVMGWATQNPSDYCMVGLANDDGRIVHSIVYMTQHLPDAIYFKTGYG